MIHRARLGAGRVRPGAEGNGDRREHLGRAVELGSKSPKVYRDCAYFL